MKKGVDYTGVTVSFFCHDGKGNYLMNKRGENCRDEKGCWDFGGGGLKFSESLETALVREVKEEYNSECKQVEYLGHGEAFRVHEGRPTHWIKFRYRVLVDKDQVINNEPNKHDEIGWFTLDKLPEPLHSQAYACMEKYKDKL